MQEIPELSLDVIPFESVLRVGGNPGQSASEGSQQLRPQPSPRVCGGNGNNGGSKGKWARSL